MEENTRSTFVFKVQQCTRALQEYKKSLKDIKEDIENIRKTVVRLSIKNTIVFK